MSLDSIGPYDLVEVADLTETWEMIRGHEYEESDSFHVISRAYTVAVRTFEAGWSIGNHSETPEWIFEAVRRELPRSRQLELFQ